jgi:hypothetical protein
VTGPEPTEDLPVGAYVRSKNARKLRGVIIDTSPATSQRLVVLGNNRHRWFYTDDLEAA